ncbi:hypothetical protein [Micromonospora sp. NPDC048898]|uniref:hypothetical protein n=1 Tax=Micromonospora sp. NPDC048898 TaxID=3364260 RepID=UPI0037172F15
MDGARPSRLPSMLLIVAMCLLGTCALPSAALFVLTGTVGGSDLGTSLAIGAPTLIAYPVAAWLWLRAGRQPTIGRAWVNAVLGFVLIVGSSIAPVAVFGALIVEEWRETQPGGRGYDPSGR